ncbi:MAG: hypothetical protein K6347_05445 [Campylobacterales bacterium]
MAAISGLGNAIYINQNMPAIAHPHQEAIARSTFQVMVNQEIFKNKEETIEETRPTEMTSAINPETHGGSGGGSERKPSKRPAQEEPEEQHHASDRTHLIDLHV